MNPAVLFGAGDGASLAVRVLAQSFAVLLPTSLLLRLAGRNRPAARYTLALCGLLCALTSPAIAAGMDRVGTGVYSAAAHRQSDRQPAQTGATSDKTPDDPARPVDGERGLVRLLLMVWAAGSSVALLGLWRRSQAATRLRESGLPFPAARLERVLPAVRAALGTAAPLPPVLLSHEVRRPVALGVLRPVVLVPAYCADELTDDELRDVLVHELAHVVQAHLPLHVLRAVIQALLWPNPLVHAVSRELGRACEEMSDNVVLRCATAPGYARTLLRVAELKGQADTMTAPQPLARVARASGSGTGLRLHWPSLSSRRWKLIDRVDGLLDGARERSTRPHYGKLAATATLLLAPGVSMAGIRNVSRTPARPIAGVSAPRSLTAGRGGLPAGRRSAPLASEVKR